MGREVTLFYTTFILCRDNTETIFFITYILDNRDTLTNLVLLDSYLLYKFINS